ncbi:hypothetical protein B0H19DRAFT_1085773 [Mycena capillaripes]|nr:hypothetical protein B0H19DRAFT_1085773 [Mycena capillaripes]
MDALIEVQVQGLRVLPDDNDNGASADYTDSIRTSTLREVLEQGEKPGGLVLNALDLPGGHFVHPNPLLGTGFDLEYIAYCQTNGLPGFPEKYPPYGEMLQQPGREHAVISSDTGDDAALDINRTATWTVGGYFFCASSIRPAMSIIFHMVMLQHILTNSDHFAMWPIFIRVNMFWLDITTARPPEDLKALAAYWPDLDNARGWMDIIYLSCMILLFPALDLRNYMHEDIPADDLSEAEAANTKYVPWHQWLAENYACFNNALKPLDWESEIFSPCLLHLAITLSKYHQQQRARDPDVEVFQSFTEKAFTQKLCAVLAGYDCDLVSQFKSKTESTWASEDTTKFFLFDGRELHLRPLK